MDRTLTIRISNELGNQLFMYASAYAIAKKLNRHLIIVDISKIKSQRVADEIFFSDKINGYNIPYNKRIYIFPDFDSMLPELTNKRSSIDNDYINIERLKDFVKNTNPKKDNESDIRQKWLNMNLQNKNDDIIPLNLSKLLNIMDGIPERTGQIIIIDTNFPENLDEAILRPGRIDCNIHFQKMNSENTKKLL